ncbi:M14-type cytosolic carboxypeptidase [Colwelliaceae bacterium 6441]
MRINSEFCGGAIEVLEACRADNIQLNITKDNQSCTRQWFYFSVETNQPEAHYIDIKNAGNVTFAKAWQGYKVFASYDNKHWFTLPTQFDGQSLTFGHESTSTIAYYAYFVPYSLERQASLEAELVNHSDINIETITTTANGNSINLLSIGEISPDKKNVWIIARQHPGESMAQWIAEGVVRSLSDAERFEALLKQVNLFVVMNMNPDGSQIGNHRTNAVGQNLNRCWSASSKESCPEVYAVQAEMNKRGVDFFLDIHGDESIPHNFMMAYGNKCVGKQFKQLLAEKEPRFQLKYDYDTYQSSCTSACSATTCGSGQTATSYVAQTFDATSLLLEASFKQLENRPNSEVWDQVSCIELGRNVAESLSEFVPEFLS